MKRYAATVMIKIPVSFNAVDKDEAKRKVIELGRSVLLPTLQESGLVGIDSNNLHEFLIFDDKESNND